MNQANVSQPQNAFDPAPANVRHAISPKQRKILTSVETVWHYTAWSYLSKIVKSGVLKCSNSLAPHEEPMLWFSANQKWEPTATKLFSNGKQTWKLTFDDQDQLAGCIRFGLNADDPRLLDWKTACNTAGTKRIVRRSLEQAGKRDGANPDHWFATSQPVPIDELQFQVWLNNAWYYATDLEGMAEVWVKEAAKQGLPTCPA